MKNLFLLLTVLFFVINTKAQTSTSLSILDTRITNDLPNFSSYSIRADFKTRSVIGVPGDGYYSTNITLSPWETSGNSGGKNHQLNFNDGGVFYRTAFPTDNQWGTWRQILMTNENGNVGIGTTSPSNKLHIIGDALKLAISENANNIGYYALLQAFHAPDTGLLSFVGAGGGGKVIGGANYGTDTSIYSNTTEKIRILNSGNVGIGINSPNAKLQVEGDISSTGIDQRIGFNTDDKFTNAFGTIAHYGMSISKDPGNLRIVSHSGYFGLNFYTNGTEKMRILQNGNVGIGSISPDSKLTVKGKIHTEEVKVDLAVPADYVFEKYYTGKSKLKPDYDLLTLSEVEKFTAINHHLPNVPSAKDIKENGLLLGEMSNVLLQKMEEMTLYMIEQEKKNNIQSKKIEVLEKENQAFKALSERLSKLESQSK